MIIIILLSLNLLQKPPVAPAREVPFGLCQTVVVSETKTISPRLVTPVTHVRREPGYEQDFWGTVQFSPVPAFLIFTHDPIRQDVFISGSVHRATEPWDPYIWNLFVNILTKTGPNTDLIVDVGANLGYFTLLAASMGRNVIAFEPMGRNMAKLQASVVRNGFQDRVTLYQNAVSSLQGNTVRLTVTHESNQGNGKAAFISRPTFGIYGVDYAETVTLDQVIRQDVLLMKIDVEGLESAVLDGAKDLLCWHIVRFITLEFSTDTRDSQLCPVQDVLTLLETLGYAISDVVPGAPRLDPAQYRQYPPNILLSLEHTLQPPALRLGPFSVCGQDKQYRI